ncbi:MAG: hypothetical protein LBL13_00060 [Bacteroidales bacterium]|nr:hypothetical protein [Bacteroidales bacterium]
MCFFLFRFIRKQIDITEAIGLYTGLVFVKQLSDAINNTFGKTSARYSLEINAIKLRQKTFSVIESEAD